MPYHTAVKPARFLDSSTAVSLSRQYATMACMHGEPHAARGRGRDLCLIPHTYDKTRSSAGGTRGGVGELKAPTLSVRRGATRTVRAHIKSAQCATKWSNSVSRIHASRAAQQREKNLVLDSLCR